MIAEMRSDPRSQHVEGPTQRISRFLSQDLWRVDLDSLGWPRRPVYGLLRIFHLAIRGFFQNRATFTASALTLISVLSLVPMLAFAFSLLKGMGAYERLRRDVIQPALDAQLGVDKNLPESALSLRSAVEGMLDLVSNTNVSSLGLVGLAVVILAVIRMLGNVEMAFNTIWGVARARSVFRKVADYLTIAIVSPFLVLVAVTLTSGTRHSQFVKLLEQQPLLGSLVDSFFGLAPLVAVWLGFTLLYITLPNVQPRLPSALLGGLVGSALFQLTQIAHIKFQMGVAHYNAIYSSFAAFPIFLVWIYLSWVTVMIGAEFAHAHEATGGHRDLILRRAAGDAREDVVALQVMLRIGRAFRGHAESWSRSALALDLDVSGAQLDRILGTLEAADLIAPTVSTKGGVSYLPARDLTQIHLSDVVIALRHRDEGTSDPDVTAEEVRSLEELYAEIQAAKGNRSIAELLDS
jgi:membrane protein